MRAERQPRGPSLAAYVRHVERAWSSIAERPLVLSPREFALLTRWHRRGIPVAAVREALAEKAPSRAARAGRGRLVSLTQVAAAVEESWTAVLEGRAGAPSAFQVRADHAPARADRWRERLAREPQGSALADVLSGLLRHAQDAQPARALDEELDRLLPAAIPDALRQELLVELDGELEPFRARLPEANLQAARRRALIERARARLGLPRLAD
jgi:hypothetical protein